MKFDFVFGIAWWLTALTAFFMYLGGHDTLLFFITGLIMSKLYFVSSDIKSIKDHLGIN